jgi:hypothetical protein
MCQYKRPFQCGKEGRKRTASCENIVDLLKGGTGGVISKLDDVAHGLKSREASGRSCGCRVLSHSHGVAGSVLELDLENTVGLDVAVSNCVFIRSGCG